jgi:hypothetical protein
MTQCRVGLQLPSAAGKERWERSILDWKLFLPFLPRYSHTFSFVPHHDFTGLVGKKLPTMRDGLFDED